MVKATQRLWVLTFFFLLSGGETNNYMHSIACMRKYGSVWKFSPSFRSNFSIDLYFIMYTVSMYMQFFVSPAKNNTQSVESHSRKVSPLIFSLIHEPFFLIGC